jgi:hypothetical protein
VGATASTIRQGGHDDVANAAAGALVQLCGEPSVVRLWERLGMPSLAADES